MDFTRWAILSSPFVLAGVVAAAGACHSGAKSAADEDREEFAGETRDTEIKHEPCETKGHTVKSFESDDPLSKATKLYVTHVFDGSQEVCSFADLNGDGRVDVFTYYGADGKIRRREASYSVDKQVDEIALYKGGELDVVMRETNFDGKLDTWDYYEGGKLVRRERDKGGDGRIDEWWTFQPGTDNATIVQADLHTGKPDPTQSLSIGLGFAPSGPAAPMEVRKAKGDAGVESGSDGGGAGGAGSRGSIDASAKSDAGPLPPSPSLVPATDSTYTPDAGKKGRK